MSPMERLAAISAEQLERIAKLGRWRHLEYPWAGALLLDLTHNDYLGIGQDEKLQEQLRAALGTRPMGSGASRLLAKDLRDYNDLEAEFATFKGAEAALYFSSGFGANEALLAALAMKKVRLIRDELCHASIVNGVRQSVIPRALKRVFQHNDLDDLRKHLEDGEGYLNIVVTEAIFSMNGDAAPLKAMKQLADQHNAVLVIDEAHSLGVYGVRGEGCLSAHGIDANQVITVNPCGKALNGHGAFIAGPVWLRPFLVNTSRAFIFSTAPSPWVVAGLRAVLPHVAQRREARLRLEAYSCQLRESLRKWGLPLCGSTSHIIPIEVGSEERVMAAAEFLRREGILAAAIRPPTVAPQTCRLRMALHAGLSADDMSFIEGALAKLAGFLGGET